MKKNLPTVLLRNIFCSLLFSLVASGVFSQSPTILIDGADVLVSGETKFPVWLNAGQTLAASTNVVAVSAIAFTLSGSDLVMNGVLKVTTVQTVPVGSVWKVESVLINPAASSLSHGWTDDGTVVRLNTPTDFVGIGTSAPLSKFSIGSTSQFQINATGAIAAATGLTTSGAVTLSTLTTAGIVTNTSAGLIGTTSIVPIANGGTGSATQNWVDLTSAQTIAGVKTWSNNAIFSGNVGIGVSPSQKLSVAGTVESTSGGFKFPDGTTQTTAAGGLVIKKGRTALVTGITYHTITPVNTYNLPITVPPNTKGVFIAVKYVHNGGNDHGYLDFSARQQNATASDDYTYFDNYHFNDYFNSDYYEQLVPWNNSGSGNAVTIQVISSHNTNAQNTYAIYYTGYIAGN